MICTPTHKPVPNLHGLLVTPGQETEDPYLKKLSNATKSPTDTGV
jgi:hypothetical protein